MAAEATTVQPVPPDTANDGRMALESRTASTRLNVSVLIPTKNRPDELALAVRSVLEQTSLPAELLILDQSLDDRGRRLVKDEFARASRKVEATVQVRHIMDPAVSGTAMARNRLLDMARGNIVLFIDDDSILEPNFVEQVIACYASHPGIAISRVPDGPNGYGLGYLSAVRFTTRGSPSIGVRRG